MIVRQIRNFSPRSCLVVFFLLWITSVLFVQGESESEEPIHPLLESFTQTPFSVTEMRTHPDRPTLLVLTSPLSKEKPDHLLEIDSVNHQVVQSVRVGSHSHLMEISSQGERIYTLSEEESYLRIYDGGDLSLIEKILLPAEIRFNSVAQSIVADANNPDVVYILYSCQVYFGNQWLIYKFKAQTGEFVEEMLTSDDLGLETFVRLTRCKETGEFYLHGHSRNVSEQNVSMRVRPDWDREKPESAFFLVFRHLPRSHRLLYADSELLLTSRGYAIHSKKKQIFSTLSRGRIHSRPWVNYLGVDRRKEEGMFVWFVHSSGYRNRFPAESKLVFQRNTDDAVVGIIPIPITLRETIQQRNLVTYSEQSVALADSENRLYIASLKIPFSRLGTLSTDPLLENTTGYQASSKRLNLQVPLAPSDNNHRWGGTQAMFSVYPDRRQRASFPRQFGTLSGDRFLTLNTSGFPESLEAVFDALDGNGMVSMDLNLVTEDGDGLLHHQRRILHPIVLNTEATYPIMTFPYAAEEFLIDHERGKFYLAAGPEDHYFPNRISIIGSQSPHPIIRTSLPLGMSPHDLKWGGNKQIVFSLSNDRHRLTALNKEDLSIRYQKDFFDEKNIPVQVVSYAASPLHPEMVVLHLSDRRIVQLWDGALREELKAHQSESTLAFFNDGQSLAIFTSKTVTTSFSEWTVARDGTLNHRRSLNVPDSFLKSNPVLQVNDRIYYLWGNVFDFRHGPLLREFPSSQSITWNPFDGKVYYSRERLGNRSFLNVTLASVEDGDEADSSLMPIRVQTPEYRHLSEIPDVRMGFLAEDRLLTHWESFLQLISLEPLPAKEDVDISVSWTGFASEVDFGRENDGLLIIENKGKKPVSNVRIELSSEREIEPPRIRGGNTIRLVWDEDEVDSVGHEWTTITGWLRPGKSRIIPLRLTAFQEGESRFNLNLSISDADQSTVEQSFSFSVGENPNETGRPPPIAHNRNHERSGPQFPYGGVSRSEDNSSLSMLHRRHQQLSHRIASAERRLSNIGNQNQRLADRFLNELNHLRDEMEDVLQFYKELGETPPEYAQLLQPSQSRTGQQSTDTPGETSSEKTETPSEQDQPWSFLNGAKVNIEQTFDEVDRIWQRIVIAPSRPSLETFHFTVRPEGRSERMYSFSQHPMNHLRFSYPTSLVIEMGDQAIILEGYFQLSKAQLENETGASFRMQNLFLRLPEREEPIAVIHISPFTFQQGTVYPKNNDGELRLLNSRNRP